MVALMSFRLKHATTSVTDAVLGSGVAVSSAMTPPAAFTVKPLGSVLAPKPFL